MESDFMWQAFTETGSPVFYMLYRAAKSNKASQEWSGPVF